MPLRRLLRLYCQYWGFSNLGHSASQVGAISNFGGSTMGPVEPEAVEIYIYPESCPWPSIADRHQRQISGTSAAGTQGGRLSGGRERSSGSLRQRSGLSTRDRSLGSQDGNKIVGVVEVAASVVHGGGGGPSAKRRLGLLTSLFSAGKGSAWKIWSWVPFEISFYRIVVAYVVILSLIGAGIMVVGPPLIPRQPHTLTHHPMPRCPPRVNSLRPPRLAGCLPRRGVPGRALSSGNPLPSRKPCAPSTAHLLHLPTLHRSLPASAREPLPAITPPPSPSLLLSRPPSPHIPLPLPSFPPPSLCHSFPSLPPVTIAGHVPAVFTSHILASTRRSASQVVAA